MKTIKIYEYNESMGMLIDVRHPLDYNIEHDPRSINIYSDKLIYNHSKYLNKNDKYYIICKNGITSKKVVYRLSLIGYNVIQVVY